MSSEKPKKARYSRMWMHFTKDNNRGKCNYCHVEISHKSGSLSNLRRHLVKKHPYIVIGQEDEPNFKTNYNETNTDKDLVNIPLDININEEADSNDNIITNEHSDNSTRINSTSSNMTKSPSLKKIKLEHLYKQNDSRVYREHFTKQISDKYDDIAKVWSQKLREITTDQRILAEKGINDIFFEASLGLLTKTSIKINEPKYAIVYGSCGTTTEIHQSDDETNNKDGINL